MPLQGKNGSTAFWEACEQNNIPLVTKLMSIPDVDVVMPTVGLPVVTEFALSVCA